VLETRPHNEAEQLISGTEAPEFCAARLPVMGGASPAVDHLDMMYCQQYKHSMGNPIIRFPWVVTPAPPVITTVNPLVVPKMICRPYEFDWSPIWSGFDHGHERLTCWTDDNLVFPKLSGSGSTGCEMESLSGNEATRQALVSQQAFPYTHQWSMVVEPALPSSVSEPSSFRDRTDTKDSLDSQFEVASAICKLDSQMINEATLLERHVTEKMGANRQEHETYLGDTGLDPTKPGVDELPSLESGPDDGPVIDPTDDCFMDDFLNLCFDDTFTSSVESWQEGIEMSLIEQTPTCEVIAVGVGPGQVNDVQHDSHAAHIQSEDDSASEIEVEIASTDADTDSEGWNWDENI